MKQIISKNFEGEMGEKLALSPGEPTRAIRKPWELTLYTLTSIS